MFIAGVFGPFFEVVLMCRAVSGPGLFVSRQQLDRLHWWSASFQFACYDTAPSLQARGFCAIVASSSARERSTVVLRHANYSDLNKMIAKWGNDDARKRHNNLLHIKVLAGWRLIDFASVLCVFIVVVDWCDVRSTSWLVTTAALYLVYSTYRCACSSHVVDRYVSGQVLLFQHMISVHYRYYCINSERRCTVFLTLILWWSDWRHWWLPAISLVSRAQMMRRHPQSYTAA